MQKLILIVIFCFIIVHGGLIKDLLSSKSDEHKNEVNAKPDVLKTVVVTLKNGTVIIVNALGDVIHRKEAKDSKPNNVESNANNVKEDTKDVKPDTEKIETKETVPRQPTEEIANGTKKEDPNHNVTTPKTDKNINSTLPSETKEKEDINKNIHGAEETTGKPDADVPDKCKDEACQIRPLSTLKGDECPKGKGRADDGTCVDEE